MGGSGKDFRACWEVGKGVKGLEVRGGFEGLCAGTEGIRGLSTVTCNQLVIGEDCWVGE